MAWIKAFLEQLNENKAENEISHTKKIILKQFDSIDRRGWEYAFNNEVDYNIFVDTLTLYFEHKDYVLPNSIKLKRNTKTRLAPLFNEIHKELGHSNFLKSDREYFQIKKILSHFEGLSNNEIYRTITK